MIIEETITGNDKIKELSIIHNKMEEHSIVNQKEKELDTFENDDTKAANTVNGEMSEVEDLDISESEEIFPSENNPLNIDCNARIVTKEVMCDTKGDDCDMQFVEKNMMYLSHRGSETGLHTSTEDLNVSDEEQSCVSALQSVNLDGLASTSSKTDTNSISPSFSHTVFKDEFSFEAEYLSDEEIRGAFQEKSGGEDKIGHLFPGLKLEGLLLTFRPPASFFSPTTQDTPDTCSVTNVSPNSMVDQSEKLDLNDDQGSPSKTCFDFTKSECSDDHNTDAEDISLGSLDDIIESSKNKNPFGKGYNAFSLPETVSEFSCGNGTDDRLACSGDSRRSSTTEFLTEDETLTLENFSDHGKKRIKKFVVSDKNEKFEDSLTDEEVIEDQ